MAANGLGPFRPGPGGMPPYLAGRETEQSLFRSLLAHLAAGEPPPSEIVLYGPRGNGKTVLLGWLRQEAASWPSIETVTLLPAGISNPERLRELLSSRPWHDRRLPQEVAVTGLSFRPGFQPPPLEEVLAARAQKNPLLLVMDEAHTLDLEVGRALLQSSQEVGRQLPFLLVLAGTPDLESHLGAMGASFWDRAKQVRVGRLSNHATAEAFRRPLESEGIRVGEAALGAMVRESQCYPYFVQLLGREIWRGTSGLPETDREATTGTLAAVLSTFNTTKGEYYRHRYRELRKRRLLPVANRVAEAFAAHPVLSEAQLEQAVLTGLGAEDLDEADRAVRALTDLGYIWESRARPEWEPGIPSLMDYIRRFAPAE